MAKKKNHKGRNRRRANKVNELVNSVINPEIRSLQSQSKQVERDYKTGTSEANNAYERGKGDIDYIYGETADYLNSLKAKGQADATTAANKSAAAAAALSARLGDTYSGVQNSVGQELARLGISGGGNMSGLMADAANAQYMGNQASQNAMSTLSQANSNADMGMALLQGMNTGSKTSAAGKNLNARNDALSQLAANRIANLNKIGDALTETRKSRSDLFTQLFNQFQQSGWKGFLRG